MKISHSLFKKISVWLRHYATYLLTNKIILVLNSCHDLQLSRGNSVAEFECYVLHLAIVMEEGRDLAILVAASGISGVTNNWHRFLNATRLS